MMVARARAVALLMCSVLSGCGGEPAQLSSAASARMNAAAGAVGQFDFVAAEAEFRALSKEYPADRLLRFDAALARMNQSSEGAQDAALLEFQQLMREEPSDLRATYCAGLCLLYLGRSAESAPLFETCVKRSPTDAYAAYFLGQSYDTLSDPAKALPWFQKSAELAPNLKSAWLGVQRCARRTRDEAVAEFALATFEALLDNPRALSAEFKYTRLGPLGVVALPAEVRGASSAQKDVDALFAAAEPLVIEDESATELRWSRDPRAHAVTVDLNLDGLQDLILLRAFANEGTDLPPNAVLLANNRGTFTLDRAHPAAAVTSVNALLVGDIDNDSRTDLYFCRDSANICLMAEDDGTYRDAAAEMQVRGSGAPTVDGALADLDHDGDLDLFLVHSAGLNELLSNNADGSFRALGANEGLAFDTRPSRQVLVIDIDRDRDADIIVLKENAPHEVWLNDRVWKWTKATAFDAFASMPAEAVVGIEDFSNAARSLVTLGAEGIARFDVATKAREFVGAQGRDAGFRVLTVRDVDGDGRSEIVEQHAAKTTLRDPALQLLAEVMTPDGTLSSFLLPLSATHGDSLLYLRAGEAPMLAKPGKGRLQFAALRLSGRDDPSQSMRSNASGLGATFAARVNESWTGGTTLRTSSSAGQSLAPVSFGLGIASSADFVEIEWSDGVMQTERAITAGEVADIVETQRQLSSCPVLFAFNGTRMEFVTDLLGVGGLGYLLEPGVYSEPRPREVFVLPEGALVPALDGTLCVALAEPMEESCMLDTVELAAIDLPQGWNIAPDERLGIFGAAPTGELVAWRHAWLPMSNDALLECDGVAATLPAHDRRFIGRLASEHTIELPFATDITQIDDPWLIIDGWVEYPYCQTMFAAWQAGAKFRAPSLEARGADGVWKELVAEWGYPAGMPRRMALPIPKSALPPSCTALRMRTNIEVYFDCVQLIAREALPAARVELEMVTATLSNPGFATRSTLEQARPYYDHASPQPLWDCRFQRGLYTAFGSVQPLLAVEDDALVVFGPGEEVACAFAQPTEPQASGVTRRFILTTHGWCKDMDLFTRDGETIEPLPSKALLSARARQLMEDSRTRQMGGR